MTFPDRKKRPSCLACLRAQAGCICRWVVPIEHAVEVLVLQHPLEVRCAKGSARLLHMSLPHSRLVVGEIFDEALLQDLLHAPFAPAPDAPGAGARQPVLLYPETPAVNGTPQAAIPDPASLRMPSRLRLVVLDGTWRKSRKMLHLNPALQSLPRLALSDMPPSHYRIRKAHRPGQLSTLEAACYALMRLEQDAARFRPLLEAFDGFVAQQAAWAGIG